MSNPQPPPPDTHQCQYALDRLKTIMILWVIAYHSAQAYSPAYVWWPFVNGESIVLGAFSQASLSAMGSFFMLSGYVLPLAAKKYGGPTNQQLIYW